MFTNLTCLVFNEFLIITCIFIIDNNSLKESKALKYYIQKMIFVASLVLLLLIYHSWNKNSDHTFNFLFYTSGDPIPGVSLPTFLCSYIIHSTLIGTIHSGFKNFDYPSIFCSLYCGTLSRGLFLITFGYQYHSFIHSFNVY